MERIKEFFQKRNYGFYVSLVSMVLSVIAAIVYAANYHNYTNFMSWAGFVMFFVGLVVSCLLFVLRQDAWAPLGLFAGNLLGLLLYVRHIYSYVQVVVAGVDISTFSSNFILSTTFIAISFVVSIVACFLPQVKVQQEATK